MLARIQAGLREISTSTTIGRQVGQHGQQLARDLHALALQVELQHRDAAEQVGAEQHARRPPGGEGGERQRDPALARRSCPRPTAACRPPRCRRRPGRTARRRTTTAAAGCAAPDSRARAPTRATRRPRAAPARRASGTGTRPARPPARSPGRPSGAGGTAPGRRTAGRASQGMLEAAHARPASPACSGCPTKAEKPAPNRLSASPVAYWLVLSQITSDAEQRGQHRAGDARRRRTPASRCRCAPRSRSRRSRATSIMPSAPRLTMPARSLISSPRPAIASTVPALSVAATAGARTASIRSAIRARARDGHAPAAHPQHAVVDQRVAGQQREQQQALEHAGQRLRQPEPRLRQLAADVEHAHQQRREDDADRVQPADEGDDDRGEAVAGRHVRRQLAERPGHLERAGQAGHAARDQQRRPQRAARREAGVARRRRRQAADLQLEAARRCGTGTARTRPTADAARSSTPMFDAQAAEQIAAPASTRRKVMVCGKL